MLIQIILSIFFSTAFAFSNPQLDYKEFKSAASQKREGFILAVADVLSEIEKKSLKVSKQSDFNCTKAGWIFDVSKIALKCDVPVLHTKCELNKIRCAPWTGRDSCVAESENSLYQCLKNQTSSEKKLFAEYFISELTIDVWYGITKMAFGACDSKKNSNECSELFKRAIDLKKEKISPKKEKAFKKTFLNPIYVMISLFANSRAFASETCGLSADGTYVARRDGSRIYLLFGIHQADGQGGTGFITNAIEQANNNSNLVQLFVRQTLLETTETRASIERQSDRIKQLSMQGKIDWVAWEGLGHSPTQAELDQWTILTNKRSQTLKDHKVPPADIKTLISYAWGPHMDDVIRGEPWATRLTSLAFDSDEMKDEQGRLQPLIGSDGFNQLSDEEMSALLEIISIVEFGKSISPSYRDNFEKRFASKNRVRAREVAQAAFDYIRLTKLRDRITADAMFKLSPGRSGALVIGGAHREGFLEEVKKHCANNASDIEAIESVL